MKKELLDSFLATIKSKYGELPIKGDTKADIDAITSLSVVNDLDEALEKYYIGGHSIATTSSGEAVAIIVNRQEPH